MLYQEHKDYHHIAFSFTTFDHAESRSTVCGSDDRGNHERVCCAGCRHPASSLANVTISHHELLHDTWSSPWRCEHVPSHVRLHMSDKSQALLLCFKMQESKISVVSSTAAATLRQLVMFIIDKVVDEDRRDNLIETELVETVLPNGEHKKLGPSALDAYSVLEDLCLLANSEKPHFLQLGSLPKTFALELIESVLTNYHDLFRAHPELLALLQHHLCPLLLKVVSDKPYFPLTLRSTRVVFILLKQFSIEFKTETEVFLALLIRVIGSDSEPNSNDGHARPLWMRILAMEIIRG